MHHFCVFFLLLLPAPWRVVFGVAMSIFRLSSRLQVLLRFFFVVFFFSFGYRFTKITIRRGRRRRRRRRRRGSGVIVGVDRNAVGGIGGDPGVIDFIVDELFFWLFFLECGGSFFGPSMKGVGLGLSFSIPFRIPCFSFSRGGRGRRRGRRRIRRRGGRRREGRGGHRGLWEVARP